MLLEDEELGRPVLLNVGKVLRGTVDETVGGCFLGGSAFVGMNSPGSFVSISFSDLIFFSLHITNGVKLNNRLINPYELIFIVSHIRFRQPLSDFVLQCRQKLQSTLRRHPMHSPQQPGYE